MKPLWNSSLYAYSVLSATSAATGFPSTRLAQLSPHPLIRAWRSTTTAQQQIVCDLGSSRNVQSIALLNGNFTDYALAHSADNSSYTSITGLTSMLVDARDTFRKTIVQPNVTNRYIRLTINAQTPTDGASYFSLGSIVITGALNTLTRDVIAPIHQSFDAIYMESGNDVIATGEHFITQQIEMVMGNLEDTQMMNLATMGRQTVFLWYENETPPDPSHIYLMRYQGAFTYDRLGFSKHANPSFKQMV